jgi:hypothetical protein
MNKRIAGRTSAMKSAREVLRLEEQGSSVWTQEVRPLFAIAPQSANQSSTDG